MCAWIPHAHIQTHGSAAVYIGAGAARAPPAGPRTIRLISPPQKPLELFKALSNEAKPLKAIRELPRRALVRPPAFGVLWARGSGLCDNNIEARMFSVLSETRRELF
ncbi:hypothetical protein EVAR_29738_1 [Eumeta japonica]|uniref:Uncharacterized protein n=1 Tax=Eumeta variegata TaxID=151549 RepID=A0A4C1VWW5_EUMVA|nr:hypothetical protein EVAR_29738_1 [Eumeta japonica]